MEPQLRPLTVSISSLCRPLTWWITNTQQELRDLQFLKLNQSVTERENHTQLITQYFSTPFLF